MTPKLYKFRLRNTVCFTEDKTLADFMNRKQPRRKSKKLSVGQMFLSFIKRLLP